MADNKRFKEVQSLAEIITATTGSLTPTGTDGVTTEVKGTQFGVLYTVLTNESGSVIVTGTDNSAAPPLPGGIFQMGKYEATLPTYADGDAAVLHTDSKGVLFTRTEPSGTATLSNVAGSASSVTLLSANTGRLGATIVNDSTANLYVKFGTTASTTSYTVLLGASAYYEVPFQYTGRIDGIWDSATGNARITELTV